MCKVALHPLKSRTPTWMTKFQALVMQYDNSNPPARLTVIIPTRILSIPIKNQINLSAHRHRSIEIAPEKIKGSL